MKIKILIAIFCLLFNHVALAELMITEARIKAPIPGQTMSAGYFELKNTGETSIAINAVSSDSASRIEMHKHVMENGMMSMVRIDDVQLAPGESRTFTEGGHHLMVFDPDNKTMLSGEFDFIFELDDGSQVEVIANVEQFVK